MPVRGRIILNGPRCGAWNMALDEGLFLSAKEEIVTLRLYSWSPPTLSLGYFQKRREVPGEIALRHPIVRRATGGGAMVHESGELTVSLTGYSKSPPKPEEAAGWMLEGIRGALIPMGIHPHFAGSEPEGGEDSLPFFCSTRKRPIDVVVDLPGGPRKLMGTAQRRKGLAWLIHGGLLVSRQDEEAQSPREASRISLLEVLLEKPGRTSPLPEEDALRNQFMDSLKESFESVFKMVFLEEPLTAEEARLACQLLAEKYSSPGWIERR